MIFRQKDTYSSVSLSEALIILSGRHDGSRRIVTAGNACLTKLYYQHQLQQTENISSLQQVNI